MKTLECWIQYLFLASSNFVYQWLLGKEDWLKAFNASYFQLTAYIVIYITFIRRRNPNGIHDNHHL